VVTLARIICEIAIKTSTKPICFANYIMHALMLYEYFFANCSCKGYFSLFFVFYLPYMLALNLCVTKPLTLYHRRYQRHFRYSSKTLTFHQNDVAMINTSDVASGKPIAVSLQCLSNVSAVNPLVACYDFNGIKGEILPYIIRIVPNLHRLTPKTNNKS
jgi:hypothetical protein